jgi:bifunctional non-homologous end joining protein LigD
VKCGRRQEFVIGGFTDPSGSRTAFGALLLGVYDETWSIAICRTNRDRIFKPFPCGTACSLEAITTNPKSPFVNPPGGSQAAGVHWVKPTLVAEVAFAEWTNEGQLAACLLPGLT